MRAPKLRPLGKITDDLEPLLEEMVDQHDLQFQEIIYLISSWIHVHRPGAVPTYSADGMNPVMVISHPSNLEIRK